MAKRRGECCVRHRGPTDFRGMGSEGRHDRAPPRSLSYRHNAMCSVLLPVVSRALPQFLLRTAWIKEAHGLWALLWALSLGVC
jgi:hypothetical protein